MALFEAAPGLGKSALMTEAAAHAEVLGMSVVSVAARDKDRSIPHGVSRRLLEPLLEPLSEREIEDIFVGAAVLAAPLFEDSPGTDGDTISDQALARLHGLFWVCANLAERGPILLALDDAQWSDPASIRFIAHLLPRLEALPIAVVVAARPDAVHHVGVPFQQLRSHAAMHLAKLEPLSKSSCEAIFRAHSAGELGTDECERYWQITQGNPFLMEQVITTHKEGGAEEVARILENVSGRVEGLAIAMTRRRLGGASEREQMFARSVAVLGPAANVPRCAQLAGLPQSEAQEALQRLAEAGILSHTQPIGFVHPLISSAILEPISSTELESLHRHAAEMLHAEGSAAELVASFLLQCDPIGEPWAADALKEAARRANAVGAQDSTVLHLRRLLRENLEDEERGRALMDLGRVEGLVEAERAVVHLRESLPYFTGVSQRAEVYRLIGHQLHALGRYEEAADIFDEAIREVGDSDKDLAFQLKVDLMGVGRLVAHRRDAALAELESLVRSEPPLEGPIAKQLYTETALIEVRRGLSCSDAAEALRHGIPDLEAHSGPTTLDWLLPVQLHCLAWTDQLELGAKLRNAALTEARRKGSLMLFATVGCFGGLSAYQEGSVSECAALAQQAIDAIPDGWAVGIPIACTLAAYAYMERGELNEAERVLDLAFSHEGTERSMQLGFLLEARARLALMWGTPESAIDDLQTAGRFATEVLKTSNPAVLGWRSRLARAYDAVGERDKAMEMVDEEIALAERYGAARPIAAALRTKAWLLGADGTELLEEALRLVESSPAKLEKAACEVALGRCLRMARDVKTARTVLNEGLRGAVLCGSAMLENVARAELVAAGARPRRRAVTGLAALTPGERRAVDLAAEGRSNREIAEALFVTVKAVEWHLSNAYRKLGIATRSGLKDLNLTPKHD